MYDKKELVNHILRTLGESTTPTLETQHPAVLEAVVTLDGVSKGFQSRGFWFNTDYNLKMLPDANGRVLLPDNTLTFEVKQCSLTTTPFNERGRFVKRGKYIYDTKLHTNVLSVAVWVDLVTQLDYADLPPTAAEYLKHRAAEEAFLNDDGDVGQYRELQQRTRLAWNNLYADQLKQRDSNQGASPFGTAMRMYQGGGIGYRGNPNIIGGGY